MKKTITLIGQKNVGKSTLFNYLTKSKESLVSRIPGSTRDRKYGTLKFNRKKFTIIDTGYINFSKKEIEKKITYQTKLAIQEADIIFFIVDPQNKSNEIDQKTAKYLHKIKKNTYLLINKIDSFNKENILNFFFILGFKKIHLISSLKKIGIKPLIKEIIFNNHEIKQKKKKIKTNPTKNNTTKKKSKISTIKLTIAGRPNSGKSTLINQIIKEKRMIVHKKPGTTRDSIDIKIQKNQFQYIFFDTAGIINKKKIKNFENDLMKKTIQSIRISNIVLFIIDINEKINKNDLLILNFILKIGKSLIIIFNKIDTISKKNIYNFKKKIKLKLNFINYVEIKFISALKNVNLKKIFISIQNAYKSIKKKINNSLLIKITKNAQKKNTPPLYLGKKINIKYVQIIKKNPMIFVIHGKNVTKLPISYKKYLKNFFYKKLKIIGIKLKLKFKNTNTFYKHKNPIKKIN